MAVHETILPYAAQYPWLNTTLRVVLVLVLGWLAIRFLRPIILRTLDHGKDATLTGFLRRVISMVSWVIVAVVALGVAGVDAAALAGGIAVGGFIIGFAVKDTLGNLAAGVTLLIYRPFDKGDTVSIAGTDGDVMDLGMAMTWIKTADARIAAIPNGSVLGGTIINHTREPKRRADVTVGISYDDDIDTTIRAILDDVAKDPRVLDDPAPGVRITALGDSSVNLQVRPWVNTDDYWQTRADLNATVKRAVEGAGCSIPYPQRDVHVHNA